MPKEIAHFVMAGKLAAALPEANRFYRAAKEAPGLFCLGAVAPDINFYYLTGPGAAAVQALSRPFHRPGRAALLPVLEFLLGRENDLAALALAGGAVCHILADTVFHPLVYYFAGMDGVHEGATARHRQFETAMDLYFWAHDTACEPSLARRLKGLEISRPALAALLRALFKPGPRIRKRAGAALRWHTGVQSLFLAGWMKKILSFSRAVGRPFPDKAAGLAYPFNGPVALPFFSGPVTFYHPCTGEKCVTRIQEMVEDAVGAALTVLDLMSAAMEKKTPLTDVPDHPRLPAIRPDLPVETFERWQGEADILQRLYQGVTPLF